MLYVGNTSNPLNIANINKKVTLNGGSYMDMASIDSRVPNLSISPADGTRKIVGTPSGSVEIRSSYNPAVPQSDLIDLDGIAAGATLVLSLGAVTQWLDISATAVAQGDVMVIDPNGVPHDLATLTILKTSGDGFASGIPVLPPGLYTFMNISGAAITGALVYARHTGARNLA